MEMEQGARIIVEKWLRVKRDDVVHFITDETKLAEAKAFEKACELYGAVCKVTILSSNEIQAGDVIEEMKEIMSYANYIVGATNFSFITTNAVNYALKKGSKFLSLPLSNNDGTSLLCQDFIKMDPKKAARMGKPIINNLKKADWVHITTDLGTDIWFDIKDRKPGLFNGVTTFFDPCASASFEVYVPPVETFTHGKVVLDGSMGYIGLVEKPLTIWFENGRVSKIEDTPDGKRLKEWFESFKDEEMYVAAELGIGLNEISQCRGASYIEDESTYTTFHIGMGRNLALGGNHEANGHFDIVTHNPTIETNIGIIEDHGQIVKGLFK